MTTQEMARLAQRVVEYLDEIRTQAHSMSVAELEREERRIALFLDLLTVIKTLTSDLVEVTSKKGVPDRDWN